MELSDIYIPPTPAQERDALRAEVERWKAKFADQAACLAAADADRIRLIAEVERLQARDAEWAQKAATWMASPEAAQRLDGYRELAAEVERLRSLLRASVTGDPDGQPRLDAWQQIHREFGEPRAAEAGGE